MAANKFKLKNTLLILVLLFTTLALTSCAQRVSNVSLPDGYWQAPKKPKKMVISVAQAPKAKFVPTGGMGLLDIAVVLTANTKLKHFLADQNMGWYEQLKDKFDRELHQKNIETVTLNNLVDLKENRYSAIAVDEKADEILFIRLHQFGVQRQYSSIVPVSKPKAVCSLTGEVYNVKLKKVIWRQNVYVSIPVEGNWDEPPVYPVITKTLKLAADSARQELFSSYFSG